MRDRLVELMKNLPCKSKTLPSVIGESKKIMMEIIAEELTDHLLENGVIVPPCKVGDTAWDTEGNAWKVFAITIWQDCIGLKTANNRDVRKTFTIGKHSIGKTVFLTKEDAEKALRGE